MNSVCIVYGQLTVCELFCQMGFLYFLPFCLIVSQHLFNCLGTFVSKAICLFQQGALLRVVG